MFLQSCPHDDVTKWKHFSRDWPFVRGISAQRPVTRSFGVFFDLRLNKRLSKQSWCWWFETLSRPLWRHCNARPLLTVMNSAVLFHTPKYTSRFAVLCYVAFVWAAIWHWYDRFGHIFQSNFSGTVTMRLAKIAKPQENEKTKHELL